MIILKSKSYTLIHHTFTHSTCTQYYWEVWVRTLLLTSGFYWNLPHYFYIIWHCYDRIYAYNVIFVCSKRLHYVSFYNVLFIIYLPLKVSKRTLISNPRLFGCDMCMYRALTDCATTALSITLYLMFLYEHINLFWHWINN